MKSTPFVMTFNGISPTIHKSAFVAPTATVIGDVRIGADSSIWYNVTVRGDVHRITIGERTNIQDGSVVHVTAERHPCHIGSDILIGHMALIHGCTLEDGCFIGMKACVMDGAVVEGGAMVAAGALVGPGKRVPAGELWGGIPARRIRDLSAEEVAGFGRATEHYVKVARQHAEMLADLMT